MNQHELQLSFPRAVQRGQRQEGVLFRDPLPDDGGRNGDVHLATQPYPALTLSEAGRRSDFCPKQHQLLIWVLNLCETLILDLFHLNSKHH